MNLSSLKSWCSLVNCNGCVSLDIFYILALNTLKYAERFFLMESHYIYSGMKLPNKVTILLVPLSVVHVALGLGIEIITHGNANIRTGYRNDNAW